MEIEQNIPKIRVCVRKRPLKEKEKLRGEKDLMEIRNKNEIIVKELKTRLDLRKYIEEHQFKFDEVFGDKETNQDVYNSVISPLVNFALKGGKVSCFAYGQTGSGKTYTMIGSSKNYGIYILAAQEIFKLIENQDLGFFVSYYEIYCGKLYDLLDKKKLLHPREDKAQNIIIVGLKKVEIKNCEDLYDLITEGNSKRVTSTTGKNQDSSRSHAVLQFFLQKKKKVVGGLSFIDLAGNERGEDTYAHDNQTRFDGAEISKSLLALKECIRALDQNKTHIPFRGSKLTMVLRDSFIGNCRTIMLGCVSPGSVNCEYSLNTLRYAETVKCLHKDKETRGDRKREELMLPRGEDNVVYDVVETENGQIKKVGSFTGFKKQKSVNKKKKLWNKSYNNLKKTEEEPAEENSNFFKQLQKKESEHIQKVDMNKKIKPLINLSEEHQKKNDFDVRLLQEEEDMENEEETYADLHREHENLINDILQEEEDLIDFHEIQLVNFDKSSQYERGLLQEVNKPGSDIEFYINNLEKILLEKQQSVRDMLNKIGNFKNLLREENDMNSRIKSMKENFNLSDSMNFENEEHLFL